MAKKNRRSNPSVSRAINAKDICAVFSVDGEVMPLLQVCVSCASLHQHVLTLIQEGANVNAVSSPGKLTALHVAAASSPSMVPLLLDAGAQVECVDAGGYSALAYAVKNGDVDGVMSLVSRGARVTQEVMWCAARTSSHRVMEILVKSPGGKEVLNSRSSGGLTPLHLASAAWKDDIVQVLLAAGAQVRYGKKEETPLCLALCTSSQRPRGVKHCLRVVRLLLRGGARVNVSTGPDQLTPLHRAAAGGLAEVTTMLLRRGAHVYARCGAHLTASELAKKHGHDAVLRAFEKHADRCMSELVKEEEEEKKKKCNKVVGITSAFASAVLMEQRGENYGLRLLVLARMKHTPLGPLGLEVENWLQTVTKTKETELNVEDAYALGVFLSFNPN
jgi:ankyrin repeat protein